MVQSNGSNGNGNGQQDYNPEVEYKYLDSDVWIEEDPQGNQDVAYTEDVLKNIEEDDSQSPPSNGNN